MSSKCIDVLQKPPKGGGDDDKDQSNKTPPKIAWWITVLAIAIPLTLLTVVAIIGAVYFFSKTKTSSNEAPLSPPSPRTEFTNPENVFSFIGSMEKPSDAAYKQMIENIEYDINKAKEAGNQSEEQRLRAQLDELTNELTNKKSTAKKLADEAYQRQQEMKLNQSIIQQSPQTQMTLNPTNVSQGLGIDALKREKQKEKEKTPQTQTVSNPSNVSQGLGIAELKRERQREKEEMAKAEERLKQISGDLYQQTPSESPSAVTLHEQNYFRNRQGEVGLNLARQENMLANSTPFIPFSFPNQQGLPVYKPSSGGE